MRPMLFLYAISFQDLISSFIGYGSELLLFTFVFLAPCLGIICKRSLATCRDCRFLTSFSSRYLGKARKRSLPSARCSVEKSGTKNF